MNTTAGMTILFLFLTLLVSAPTQAQSGASSGSQSGSSSGSDKLDLKKLEDKYWSAKDADFSVVQNRTYTKAGRMFLSGSYGILVNDAYSYGRMFNGSAGYYFNERWGFEFANEQAWLRENDTVNAIDSQNGLRPNYNKFINYRSLNMLFVPFYSKTSFMDRSIMYFDIQFGIGVGQMTYEMQADNNQIAVTRKSAFGYNFDVTQQLFFSEHFALRLDIKNKWSKQDLQRYRIGTTESETARPLYSYTQQDTTILLGLTIFFGKSGSAKGDQ